MAIDHFPKAREERAKAIRFYGERFADSALQVACMSGAAELTAVEKQARYLLELTFMHPATAGEHPHNLDAVKDAELIADNARTMELIVEVQPQTEAKMLDAARLLCELMGYPFSSTRLAVSEAAGDGCSLSRMLA